MKFLGKSICFVFCFILALTAFSVAQTPEEKNRTLVFQKGVDAYEMGKYKEALDQWLSLAQAGDGISSRNIAHLYENGFGVQKDLSEALRWYVKSADMGVVLAQYRAGMMYLQGEGTDQNLPKAINYLTKSAQAGHPPAQYNLGVIYEQGIGVPPDKEQAKTWFYNAAGRGHDKALAKIGQIKPTDSQPAPIPAPPSSSVASSSSLVPKLPVDKDLESFMKEDMAKTNQSLLKKKEDIVDIQQTPSKQVVSQKSPEKDFQSRSAIEPSPNPLGAKASVDEQFAEREKQDKTVIIIDEDLQNKKNNHFFGMESEVKRQPLPEEEKMGVDTSMQRANPRNTQVGNPYDPVYVGQQQASTGGTTNAIVPVTLFGQRKNLPLL
jgi:hypothetical protein